MSPTPQFYLSTSHIKKDGKVDGSTKCTYCGVETGAIYIHCEKCPDFDLCLQCFVHGAEIGQHKRYHCYKIRYPPPDGPFSTSDPWTLTEEHLLLYGIDDFGYGSWDDCARLVSGKTPEECRRHFETFYLGGVAGWMFFPKNKHSTAVEHPKHKSDVNRQGCQILLREAFKLIGFSSKRDEFEIEYDNFAEAAITLSVAHLDYETASHEMEDLDIEFKLARLDHYRRRLAERERRKRLVIDYGLIGLFSQKAISLDIIVHASFPLAMQRGNNASIAFQKLLPFKTFREFFASLHKVNILTAEIQKLQEYRLNGLTRINEIIPFQIAKSRR